MSTIVFCLIVALVLFFLEIFLPGGILGIFGLGFVVWATISAYLEYGGYVAMVILIFSLLVAITCFFIEIKILANSSWGKRNFLTTTTSKGQTGLVNGEELHGKEGVTITRMNPGGQVLIDGKSYTARSLEGYLTKDTKIVVETHEGFMLRVKSLINP